MLRNLNISIDGNRILGTPRVGVLASEIPSIYDYPPLLVNDIDVNDPPGCLYRVEILTWPSDGYLGAKENSSFIFGGSADGTFSGDQRVYKYSPDSGLISAEDTTYSFTVGVDPTTSIDADLTATFNVNGATTAVNKDLSATFTVNGATSAVSSNLSATFTVNGAVSAVVNDLTATYSVESAVLSTAVVAFGLTAPTNLVNASFVIGQPFIKGAVPSGKFLALDLPNFSIVPHNYWNDGSVKHASIIGRVSLSANQEKQVNVVLRDAAQAVGTPLTSADIILAAPQASVQCGTFGTVTLSSLLASPVRTFISTKEMVECHYTGVVGSDASLHVHFHVRLFADGRMWIRAVVGNAYLNSAERIRKDYIPTVIIGGVTVFDNGGLTYYHSAHARYDLVGWIGSDPQITPRHDTSYLMKTKMVPNYWKFNQTPDMLIKWIPVSNYVPGENLAFSAGMGGVGFQEQIGLLPNWEAVYITSRADPLMYKTVVAHGRAINSYAIEFLNQTNKLPVKLTDFPRWSVYGLDQGGSPGLASVKQDLSTLQWESAHFPASGYLPYLLTGDYYFLEATTFTAINVYLCNDINGGTGTNRLIRGQNRARAWGFRSLAHAAAVIPDSQLPVFGELKTWLKSLSAQKVTNYVSNPTSTAWIGYEDMFNSRLDGADSLTPGGHLCAGTAPWEHHFNTMSTGMASDIEPIDDAGMVNLNLFRDYLHGAPVWIMGGTQPTEYNFGYSSTYTVNIRINSKTNGTFDPVLHDRFIPTDPGMIFSDTFSAAEGDPINATTNVLAGTSASHPTISTGYYGNLLPALAYAVDHNKTGADVSWSRFINADNFSDQDVEAGYDAMPVWGIVPRSYSQQPLTFTAVDAGDGTTPTEVISDLAASYQIIATSEVSSSFSAAYSITNFVSVDLTGTYALFNSVSNDFTGTYSITNFVSSDFNGTYSITTSVDGDFSGAYSITNFVSSDFTSAYELLNSVSNDLAANYSVFNEVSNDFVSNYVLYNEVVSDLNASYVFLTLVANDFTCSYSLESPVSIDFLAAYDINVDNTAWSDFNASYNIFNSVSADLPISYSIFTSVSSDLNPTYDILQSVSTTLTVSYDILQSVSSDLYPVYSIFTSVSSNLSATYDILQSVSNDLVAAYSLLLNVESDLTGSYEISPPAYIVSSNLTGSYAISSYVVSSMMFNYNVRTAGADSASQMFQEVDHLIMDWKVDWKDDIRVDWKIDF